MSALDRDNSRDDRDDPLFEEVHRLICAQTEDRLTPEGARRLESLVLTDPRARTLYAMLVRDSAYLRWYAEAPASAGGAEAFSSTGDLGLDEAAEAVTAPVAGRIAPRSDDALVGAAFTDTELDDEETLAVAPNYVRAPEPEPRWPIWARYAAAAAVLIVVGVAATLLVRRSNTPPVVVVKPLEPPALAPVVYAKLTDTVDAAWEMPVAPRVGQDLGIGPWALSRGTARVVFGNGADVVFRAPARFQLLSADAMLLTEGVASAVAGKQAAGFVIHTPTATVRDIGTEFGVRVEPTGVTEAHVLVGAVDLKPAAGGQPVRLTKKMAAAVKADGRTTEPVAFAPARFGREMRSIDLVDIVAGGDGTQGRRGAGIDPRSGLPVNAPPAGASTTLVGDGAFHPCPQQPLIAGVFIPPAAGQPAVIDPAGHTVTDLRISHGNCWYWIWAGGPVALPEDPLRSYPTTLGTVDYAAGGRGLIFMQPNKGITFDLAAIRAAHPGRAFTRLRATCGNSAAQFDRARRDMTEFSDVRILVDGKPAVTRAALARHAEPFTIDVPLPVTARYLTLLVTDGGDDYQGDWILFGDPRLE